MTPCKFAFTHLSCPHGLSKLNFQRPPKVLQKQFSIFFLTSQFSSLLQPVSSPLKNSSFLQFSQHCSVISTTFPYLTLQNSLVPVFQEQVIFKIKKNNNFFLAALGLCCCIWAFFSCAAQLLIVVASLVVEHRLQAHGPQLVAAQGLISCGSRALQCRSVVVVRGLSCSVAYGIFLDQGLNLCPLHQQADCYPLHHQGGPSSRFNCILTFFLLATAVVLKLGCNLDSHGEFPEMLVSTEGFQGRETILNDSTVMDTCLCTFVKTVECTTQK